MADTNPLETQPVVASRRRTAWQKGQSGNPAGRSPRAAQLRQLLDPHKETLVARCIDMALGGDAVAMRLCLERIAPPPKPESAPVQIPGLVAAKSMSDKARAVVDAVGAGVISPDAGAALLGAIASASKIIETDELAARIAALEAQDS